MSNQITITGPIAGPELRTTPAGKQVLDLRLNATHAAKNRDTNRYEDQGQSFWVTAPFWDAEAERLASMLNSGDRVTVSGSLFIEEYTKRDGTAVTTYRLAFPRFLGVIPKQGQQAPQQSYAQGSYQKPASDPWGQTTADAPF